MTKASDLNRAHALVKERERLSSLVLGAEHDKLTVTLGDVELVLTDEARKDLLGRIVKSTKARIVEIDGELAKLGVEV